MLESSGLGHMLESSGELFPLNPNSYSTPQNDENLHLWDRDPGIRLFVSLTCGQGGEFPVRWVAGTHEHASKSPKEFLTR